MRTFSADDRKSYGDRFLLINKLNREANESDCCSSYAQTNNYKNVVSRELELLSSGAYV